MQMMDRRGLRWHATHDGDRLEIGLLLPERLFGHQDGSGTGSAPTKPSGSEFGPHSHLAHARLAEADRVVVEFAGRIDESTYESFQSALLTGVEEASQIAGMLEVDLGDTDYISSRGLRALTIARRQADAHGVVMTLANPNKRVSEILAISRYDTIFEVRTGS